MTQTHHPLDDTLIAFASGTLDEARHFVIAAHLHSCAKCRQTVAMLHEVGGALLESANPAELSVGALDRALAKIEPQVKDNQQRSAGVSDTATSLDETLLQDLLSAPGKGPWNWVAPGVHVRSLLRPAGKGARVFLLKAAPGLGLPNHTHTGTELTLVLQGAFSHAAGRFSPGDLDDADETDEHTPLVEPGQSCICLVAMDGQLKLRGLLGLVMQPFVRI